MLDNNEVIQSYASSLIITRSELLWAKARRNLTYFADNLTCQQMTVPPIVEPGWI